MRQLPSGTVTFVFTDIEGSTKLLDALGAEAYAEALAEHRRILRDAFSRHGGAEVDTQGDAFFVAFPTAPGALAAAAEATQALASGPIRVRIGLHTGTPVLTDEGYVGADVHRAARIAVAGHGGQILVSAATAQLVAASGLQDLGLHRLKDLGAPERIYQLGERVHPPLKTLHQTNLPIPATPFLGREAEVTEIAALLRRHEVHLITLTGPGGTGKTRLALQAAGSGGDHFPAGVWWVPLASLRDPGIVVESAATALGASGDLAEHIGDSRLLLLLDNFEHLTEAAADLAPLLAKCPNLTLLVTSREPLHLAGEYEYAVDPLDPDEAFELFVTRAVAAKRDFTADDAVASICARLDNLPLAIELAAARVKVLSPTALLERLEQRLELLAGGSRDLPERQRTLRATIEWSHELLDEDEQRLFARLAVFRGGCTLDAAEAIVEADLDTLQSLVDKSLARVRDSGRFWMLETIREFAVERLEASGEADELRRRHAEFFTAMLHTLAADYGRNARRWLERIESEHDNLRAVLDWYRDQGLAEPLMSTAGELAQFWYTRGHIAEGRARIADALAMSDAPTAGRARALNGWAQLSVEGAGEASRARAAAEEALSIYTALDDQWGIAHSHLTIAEALSDDAMWEAARAEYQEARSLFLACGDEHYHLVSTRLLAWMYFELGDLARARATHEENLERARQLGNERIVGTTLGALGEYDVREWNLSAAMPRLVESWEIFRALNHPFEIAVVLCRFAWVLARAGHPDPAAQVLARSFLVYDEIPVAVPAWIRPTHDEIVADIRAQVDPDAYEDALRRGRLLSIEQAVALALEHAPARGDAATPLKGSPGSHHPLRQG